MPDEPRPFRILSLDGGGTWALIEVKALIDLYGSATGGRAVLARFDLAIANSGGSIVLAALAADLPLSEILKLFEEEDQRKKIFVSLCLGPLAKKVGFGPRYRASAKLRGLREVLGKAGDVRMRDWEAPTNDAGRRVGLVICGFDYERLREVFFRTVPEGLSAIETSEPIPSQQTVIGATFAEAAHASSNAPVNYFNAPARFGAGRFWDGAMGGYNNPVLAGVVEAVSATVDQRRVDRADARVLSIGTGNVVLPEAGTALERGLVLPRRAECLPASARAAATVILDDPPDAASFVAHVMLGGRLPAGPGQIVADGRVVRMNPLVQPVPGKASGAGFDWAPPAGLEGGKFAALANIDMDAVKQGEVDQITSFADLWIAGGADPDVADETSVRNQPIRASRWLEVEIGHGTFGAAKRAWNGG